MTDNDKPTDPAAKLAEAPEQPQTQVYIMVTPQLMQSVIKQLSKQKASKVYGLLNALNGCQTVTAEVKPNG